MPEWFHKQTVGALVNQAADRYGPREALLYEGAALVF